jgi:translation initiation factor IF-2
MGHVDHGKTTLLDAFRVDHNKCSEEYGQITQAIGAFTIRVPGI